MDFFDQHSVRRNLSPYPARSKSEGQVAETGALQACNEKGPQLSLGPFFSALPLRVAARNGHELTVVMMVMMMAPIVVMVVVMMAPDNDHAAMVMVVMMVMILGHLNAAGTFGGRPLRTGRIVSIQKGHRIRNGRQQVGV
jgi:hypothetical protein